MYIIVIQKRMISLHEIRLINIQPDFLHAGELAAQTLMDIAGKGGKYAVRPTSGPTFVMRRASSRTFCQYDAEVLSVSYRNTPVFQQI